MSMSCDYAKRSMPASSQNFSTRFEAVVICSKVTRDDPFAHDDLVLRGFADLGADNSRLVDPGTARAKGSDGGPSGKFARYRRIDACHRSAGGAVERRGRLVADAPGLRAHQFSHPGSRAPD